MIRCDTPTLWITYDQNMLQPYVIDLGRLTLGQTSSSFHVCICWRAQVPPVPARGGQPERVNYLGGRECRKGAAYSWTKESNSISGTVSPPNVSCLPSLLCGSQHVPHKQFSVAR